MLAASASVSTSHSPEMETGKCQMLSVLLAQDSLTTGVFASTALKGPFSQCYLVSS